MTVVKEYDFESFEPWSGAVDTWERIKNEGKLTDLEFIIQDLYPDGIEETKLNDILWFDDEWVFESLGIRSYDKIKEELNEKKAELEEMENNLNEEIKDVQEDEDYTEEDIQDIYKTYEDDINDLKEEIKELEEELENA